jgi:hypothetical protein
LRESQGENLTKEGKYKRRSQSPPHFKLKVSKLFEFLLSHPSPPHIKIDKKYAQKDGDHQSLCDIDVDIFKKAFETDCRIGQCRYP